MPLDTRICGRCAFECWLLRHYSPFPEDSIELYEDRYGLCDGIVRSWTEMAREYGYSADVTMGICEDIQKWLDRNSPYLRERFWPEQEPHMP